MLPLCPLFNRLGVRIVYYSFCLVTHIISDGEYCLITNSLSVNSYGAVHSIEACFINFATLSAVTMPRKGVGGLAISNQLFNYPHNPEDKQDYTRNETYKWINIQSIQRKAGLCHDRVLLS